MCSDLSSPLLAALIRDLIAREGPISFARFMKLALYHPEHGYYASGRCVIGRRGDYFTSVSVGPLFGRMMAAQFAEVWEMLSGPADFTIVEQGAHQGEFAHDVLTALEEARPEVFASMHYRIVEPFSALREQQEIRLGRLRDKVEWTESLATMPAFNGVHFSNELLDALPVHLVVADEGKWRERFVETLGLEGQAPSRPQIENGDGPAVVLPGRGFVFVDRPVTNERLQAALAKIPPLPSEHYETEINLAALSWMETLAPKLQRGLILIADYGFTRENFYSAHRRTGTLQSYANHRVLASPLARPGESDLTAHVEWTSLAERAETCGLTIAGFADQHHFLIGLLAQNPQLAASVTGSSRALQTLLHPEFLGTRFQFLGLAKNFTGLLGGFRFARSLGLTP